jgi:hypothetical protein
MMVRVRFPAAANFFPFATASRLALVPSHPPIQWVPGTFSLGIRWPGRDANHSPPVNAEVKNEWSYTSSLPYVFMPWCIVKHRDSFTFTELYQVFPDEFIPLLILIC